MSRLLATVSFEDVGVGDAGFRAIRVVRFENQSTKNSLDLVSARALRDAFSKPSAERFVLAGRGRVFCSGGNLAEYRKMQTREEGTTVNREISDILHEISQLNVVGAISGDAFGGGVELMSVCQYLVSVPHAVFGLWQQRMGLSFGWGGGLRLRDRIGDKVLSELAQSTRTISADEALSLGLVDELVHPSHLIDIALARSRATNVRNAIAARCATVHSTERADKRTAERDHFESLWWSAEHLAKLKSVFLGF